MGPRNQEACLAAGNLEHQSFWPLHVCLPACRLVLAEPRVLAKPDESISLEEPDHASLLSSCLASLDQPECAGSL
jgi:hypothetical protein